MKVFVGQIGKDKTVAFAADQLVHYLRKMDPASDIAHMIVDEYDPSRKDVLFVGMDQSLAVRLPGVREAYYDDAILLDVARCAGIVTGSNPRSVLIAAYRLLREGGCAFIRPDDAGEILPQICLSTLSAQVCEAPDLRHRGVCIEGCLSYQHVINMIDWLPKVGMNAYFTQFVTPYTFFEWWYAHRYNTSWQPYEISKQTVAEMTRKFVDEVQKRGLLYHAVGHAWTCEPFGLDGSAWTAKEYDVPEMAKPLLAQIKGKRELFENIPLNTNLCYGNQKARDVITDAIANHCQAHPEIDYLHFWLADNSNNHCECELCTVKTPSDFYVTMLNELDEKMTARGLKARVVFLAYVDTLWAPKSERIHNPDRFCLMFAPITRRFDQPLPTETYAGRIAPYVRNRNTMPESVMENVALLREWLSAFPGDGFDYDYHMGLVPLDFGGYLAVSVLTEDMKNMKKLGLNGMVSCQGQRAFFPTSLAMNAMAAALWDNALEYDPFVRRYYDAAFGEDGPKVYDFMRTLSGCVNVMGIRHKKTIEFAPAETYLKALPLVEAFRPVIDRNLAAQTSPGRLRSWEIMKLYMPIVTGTALMLSCKARGEDEAAKEAWAPVGAYLERMEENLHPDLEMGSYLASLGRLAGVHYTIRVNE